MNHFSNDLHEFWPHNAPVDLWSFDAGAATAPGAQGRGLPPDCFFFLQRYNAAWRLPHLFLNKNISKWFTWKKQKQKTYGFFIIFSMTQFWDIPISRQTPQGSGLVGSRSSCLGVYSRWDRMFSEVVWWIIWSFGPLPGFRLFQNLRLWDFDLAQFGPGSILRVFWPKTRGPGHCQARVLVDFLENPFRQRCQTGEVGFVGPNGPNLTG